ncbi:hypothetical protein [Phenylobacterium conjunctum]|uniref:Uncharacterized protein n=1 Tax=Phenylobacterium conjunctum TaxID=1298959 RepID=A0ABW3T5A0_9CAUL
MPKRDPGTEERNRLRNLPGEDGEIWRGVYGRDEADWLEALTWEEDEAQRQRPHIILKKYNGSRGKPNRKATQNAREIVTPPAEKKEGN